MSATSEPISAEPVSIEPNSSATPVAAAVHSKSWVSMLRIVPAIAITLGVLHYAWGVTLVIAGQYSWRMVQRQYVLELVGGLAAVIGLTWHLSAKFRSRRTAWGIVAGVGALWTAEAAALIVFNTGDGIPRWLAFVGLFPATLCVLWAAWMFFFPIRWSVRLGVLALLIGAIYPYLHFFEITGMTGDAKLNFALRGAVSRAALIKSSVGELSTSTAKLVANPKTDFPAFQGPGRDAVLLNVKLDRDWDKNPPKQVWREAIGAGWSGFVVVGGYAFTQEQRGEDECVVCRDVKTGKEIWVHSDKAPFENKPRYEGMGGPGPRCTPTVDDGRAYTVGATGIFNCLDAMTGHPIWTHNIVTENGGSVAVHGVCGSPLIVGNFVVVAPTGKPAGSLAAYDRVSGKQAWCTGVNNASYATPMLASVAGVEQILNWDEHGLTGHDPTTGKVLWHFVWGTAYPVCSQPIANAGAPDQILATVGYGRGSALIKVSCAADGKWSAEALWESKRMKTKFTTAVSHNGYAYGLDDGIMQCIEIKSGKQMWKGGHYEHGQILLACNTIIVQTEPGPVVLIDTNPKRLTELGSVPALSSKTWNCPALAGKYLLVRNDQEAVCYEVSLAK
jgi:outer membrane protein assembly factor BamB